MIIFEVTLKSEGEKKQQMELTMVQYFISTAANG